MHIVFKKLVKHSDKKERTFNLFWTERLKKNLIYRDAPIPLFFYTEVVEYKHLHLRSIASWRHCQSRYSMRTAFWDRDRGGAMWSGCVCEHCSGRKVAIQSKFTLVESTELWVYVPAWQWVYCLFWRNKRQVIAGCPGANLAANY